MSNENETQWQGTGKASSLITGLLLILLGLLGILVTKGRWRYSLPIGAGLIAAGLVAVIYSTTIHAWCAPVGAAAFGAEWGAGFWHGPSAWDCWHLIYGPKGR